MANIAVEFPRVDFSVAQLQISGPDSLAPVASTTLSTSLDKKQLEHNALETFRELVSGLGLDDYQMTDAMLMRWLLSREMDPIKATTMLKEDLAWRKENDIDNILNWDPPSHLVKDFPFQLCGPDANGDLFGVVKWSKMDVDGAVKAINEGTVHAEYLRYLWKALEIVRRIYKETSTPEHTVTQGTVIVDLEGFSMYQFASPNVIAIVLEVVRRYEASYPNKLKAAIVVNTPTVFTVLWNMMKPFLSEYTLSRVQIYGWVGQDWKSVLRTMLPVQNLPSFVGGANTTCRSYDATHGYTNLQPEPLEDFPKTYMVPITVPAGQKFTVDINVVNSGSKLSWGFRSDYYDIGFTVLNEANEEIVENCRVDAHVLQQKGFVICNTVGKYTFVFDNTFSQYRSKSVYYTIKVTPPVNPDQDNGQIIRT